MTRLATVTLRLSAKPEKCGVAAFKSRSGPRTRRPLLADTRISNAEVILVCRPNIARRLPTSRQEIAPTLWRAALTASSPDTVPGSCWESLLPPLGVLLDVRLDSPTA